MLFDINAVPDRMKTRFAGKPDHLSICFWMWSLFNSVTDEDYPAFCEKVMREIKERGFNCVRMDDGAGLICDIYGKPRGPVRWHLQAGPYQATRQRPGEGSGLISKRLLIFCRTAAKYGIQLIFSSWYYLHKNWQLEESINAELFEGLPTAAEKIRYFTAEHNRILQLLRENDLLQVVAFVELCNEFSSIRHAITGGSYTREEAAEWRVLLEDAYDCMKRKNPELLFAYDNCSASWFDKDLIPRNVDVLNVHCYYMWSGLYDILDKGITEEQRDMEFPPETAYFLRKDRLHYEDIVRERSRYTKIRGSHYWNQRMVVYNSLDPEKIPELEKILAQKFDDNHDAFMQKLKNGIAAAVKVRDEILPGAPIVMGEGASCCTSDKVLFEERSDKFWQFLEWQALFLRESGLWGSVVRTGSSPVDISWNMRAGSFRKINELFLHGERKV